MKLNTLKRRLLKLLGILFLVYLMICLVLSPEKYIPTTFEGIKLWAVAVLPSLLPFFFLTQLLTSSNTLSKISDKLSPLTRFLYNCGGISAYAQIMSMLSGYPVGAKIILELYEKKLIDEDEAKRMCVFCSTSGPLFIVGTVGIAMFESKIIGIILIISHLLSSIICGIIYRFVGKSKFTKNKNIITYKNVDNVLYDCVYSSVLSVLIVGGFIAVFYCLSEILIDNNLLYPLQLLLSPIGKENATAVSVGIIECTKGCKLLSTNPSILNITLAEGLISFGGISIICQSIVYLQKAKVKTIYFVLAKLLQMLISMLVCFSLSKILLS